MSFLPLGNISSDTVHKGSTGPFRSLRAIISLMEISIYEIVIVVKDVLRV
jgi:hypothetical protein